jgi:hypothetical protein
MRLRVSTAAPGADASDGAQENSSDATMRQLLQLAQPIAGHTKAGVSSAAGVKGAAAESSLGSTLGSSGVTWGGGMAATTSTAAVAQGAARPSGAGVLETATAAPTSTGTLGSWANPASATQLAAATGMQSMGAQASGAATMGTLTAAATQAPASHVLTAGSANAATVGALPGTTSGGSGVTGGIVSGSANAVSAAAASAAAASQLAISALTAQASPTSTSSSSSGTSSLSAPGASTGTTKKDGTAKACAKGQKRCPNADKCVVVTENNCGSGCGGPCANGQNCNFQSGTCSTPCNNACQATEVCTNNQCLPCTAAQGMQMCGTDPYTAGCLPIGKSC